MSPPAWLKREPRSKTTVLRRTPSPPVVKPPAMMTFWPILAHPGQWSLLVLSLGHLPSSLHPLMLVGPAMSASNSRIWVTEMARKQVGEMVTAQGWYILTGGAGPSCHCILPAARKSLVLVSLSLYPPMMKTPTELRVATAAPPLSIVRSSIKLSSQRWLLWSRTRQEAVSYPPTLPPQVAMTGLGSEVKNVVWSFLAAGRGGGEQSLVLG